MDLERERGARSLYFAAVRVASETRGARRQRDSYEANNPPGLFFGVVPGVKGYFRRPRRRLGKLLGKLMLLLRAQPEAHYRPRFDFPGAVASSFRENAASADFARNLEKEIAYRLEKSAAGRATGTSPSFRCPSWHGK